MGCGYMAERNTNFALLCDLLEVSPKHLSDAISADITLVSRWRTGNRKLMPGRDWATHIAEYLLVLDDQIDHPICNKLLQAYFPGRSISSNQVRTELLAQFLSMPGQARPEYQQRRFELLSALFPGRVRMPGHTGSGESGKPIFGVAGLQSTVMEFIAIAAKAEKPCTLKFACPIGLDMLIGDENFALRFLDKLNVLFERGFRLEVCLSGEYKPTIINQFTRRWMWAHMRGYIKSYFYDHKANGHIMTERMMAVIPDRAAFVVFDIDRPAPGAYTSLLEENQAVNDVEKRVDELVENAKQQIQYHFFENPASYLRGVEINLNRPCYSLAQMPHFGIAKVEDYPALFGMDEEQIERLKLNYAPLLITPDEFPSNVTVRYIFCQDEIDEKLMKSRHGVAELSEMLDKQIYMTTRMLARQLRNLQQLMQRCHNFEIAFLPRYMIESLQLQLTVWGNSAAIGSVLLVESSACKEPRVCAILNGQFEQIWKGLPLMLRSRSEANKKLAMWMEKARRYGVWTEKE